MLNYRGSSSHIKRAKSPATEAALNFVHSLMEVDFRKFVVDDRDPKVFPKVSSQEIPEIWLRFLATVLGKLADTKILDLGLLIISPDLAHKVSRVDIMFFRLVWEASPKSMRS